MKRVKGEEVERGTEGEAERIVGAVSAKYLIGP